MDQQTVEKVNERRKILRVKTEERIKQLFCRIVGLPRHKKILEIRKELGLNIHFVDEELHLSPERLGSILAYRIMNGEVCPAADLGLCIGGLKNLITREKCIFCDGHGTAEWDNY